MQHGVWAGGGEKMAGKKDVLGGIKGQTGGAS